MEGSSSTTNSASVDCRTERENKFQNTKSSSGGDRRRSEIYSAAAAAAAAETRERRGNYQQRDFGGMPQPYLPAEKSTMPTTTTTTTQSPGATGVKPDPHVDGGHVHVSSKPSRGVLSRLGETSEQADARLAKISAAVRVILECVGEDADREGLAATPERCARAMLFLTEGYQQSVPDVVHGALFTGGHGGGMVVVRDIELSSLCEHHLLPFFGKMHIGYLPGQTVIGLSKLARIATVFARRLQIQERLTEDVARAVAAVLAPRGVAVVMEASHLCMRVRGVEKACPVDVTNCFLGCFERDGQMRSEFLSQIRG